MREDKHLSYSQINTYRTCPMRYYFRYIKGLKIPPPWAIPLGKSVHQGIGYNLKQKIQTRQDLPLPQVLDAYDFAFESQTQGEVDWQDKKRGIVKDMGVGLVSLHHQERCPDIQPLAVEDKVKIPFSNVDYCFLAYLDLIDQYRIIVDIKTSQRSPSEVKAVTSDQLTAYALAFRVKYGKAETGVRLEYLVNTKDPQCKLLNAKRTSQEIDAFLEIVARVQEGIEKEVFYPCSEDNWVCSPKSCGYYPRCKPKRTVVSLAKLEEKNGDRKNTTSSQQYAKELSRSARGNSK